MNMYRSFCQESFDAQGNLTDFSLTYPTNFNFAYDVVDAMAEQAPNQTALVWCNAQGLERTFTFSDLRRLSNQAANALRAHGISKGDTVLVMLKRHYEYWFVALALHKLGAVMAPVTHMLTVSDLVYRVAAGNISAAICTNEEEAPQRFLEAKETSALRTVFTIRENIPGCVNLSAELDVASPLLSRVDTAVTDPLLTYFTSGTTGQPKGVIHDHSYPLAHIVTAKYWHQAIDGGLHFTVAESGWAKSSWGKLYGQWLVGSAVMVYDFDSFDPRQLIQVIQRYGVTTFCAPPTIYRYLIKTGLSSMPSLQHVTTAGEALNPEVYTRFREVTGLSIQEGYGQTETTPLIAHLPWVAPRPGSMGKPTPLYRVALQNPDGSETPEGEVGEIVILPDANGRRPVGIFCAYCGNEELYQNAWRGGVYHTGDTAWRDADGYYWFNGRSDDIIKTGGYRVGPFEIENVLMEHPAVLECSVIGIPDPLRGQAIKAFVHLAPGFEASSELKKEIKVFCNEHSSEYKWIRHIDFVEEMPKTISGKIKKRDLREWDAIH